MKNKKLVFCHLILIICLMITTTTWADEQKISGEQVREGILALIDFFLENFNEPPEIVEDIKNLRGIILESDIVDIDIAKLPNIKAATMTIKNYTINDDGTKTLIETITKTGRMSPLTNRTNTMIFNQFFPGTGNIIQKISLDIHGTEAENTRTIVLETNFEVPENSYSITISSSEIAEIIANESVLIIDNIRGYEAKRHGQPAIARHSYGVRIKGQLFTDLPEPIVLIGFTEAIEKKIFLAFNGTTRGYHVRLTFFGSPYLDSSYE